MSVTTMTDQTATYFEQRIARDMYEHLRKLLPYADHVQLIKLSKLLAENAANDAQRIVNAGNELT